MTNDPASRPDRRTSSEGAPASTTAALSTRPHFGPFSLRNQGATLYRLDEPVRIGSRARQILTVLIARAGEVVSKADLMLAVWPDSTVVENNLTVHVAALRQVLGEGQDGMRYIVNVPGRGYRFVAPVLEAQEFDHALESTVSSPPIFPPD